MNADAVVGCKASLDPAGHLSIQDPQESCLARRHGYSCRGRGWQRWAPCRPSAALTHADFTGNEVDPANKTGLLALGDVDEISLLCCPDEYYFGANDSAIAGLLQQQCELMKDRFAILQAPVAVKQPANNNPSVNSKVCRLLLPLAEHQ